MSIDVKSKGFFVWQRDFVSADYCPFRLFKLSQDAEVFFEKIAYSLLPSLSRLHLYDRDALTLGLDNNHKFISNRNCYRPRWANAQPPVQEIKRSAVKLIRLAHCVCRMLHISISICVLFKTPSLLRLRNFAVPFMHILSTKLLRFLVFHAGITKTIVLF